jgi:hypothetical protein
MLQALQRASFMDGMMIHDWREHNSYHEVFAARAKKAAAARWKGQEKKKTRQEKKGQDKTRASIGEAMLEAFSEFWRAYPKRVGKGNAEAAWKKNGCDRLLPQIIAAVQKCKSSADWTKEAGQFIPHPATWLNRRGWEDELTPIQPNLHSQKSEKYGF